MTKDQLLYLKKIAIGAFAAGALLTLLMTSSAFGCPMNQQRWDNLLDQDPSSSWEVLGEDDNPWTMDRGELVNDGSAFGSDLLSTKSYEDFVLYFEVSIGEGGNSGIKYLVDTEHAPVGLEYQILDNVGHPDARIGKRRHFGALYDLIPSDPIAPPQTVIYQAGCVVKQGRRVQHWVNQEKVVDVDLDSERFQRAFKRSKFRSFPWFAKQDEGRILIQDHGDPVKFRKLMMAPL